MTQIRIENPIETEFAMVPNGLWRSNLTFKAKGLYAYLLSYRHGGAPTVRQIEEETGLGRDARRKAMAELIEAGLASYEHVRKNGMIVGKELVVSTATFIRAPENQAHGENHRAPENPAVGKSTPKGVKIHPSTDWKSGDNQRERKIKGAANARKGVKSAKLQNPWASSDPDVNAAARAFMDRDATKRECEQIAEWLKGQGYGLPSDYAKGAVQ